MSTPPATPARPFKRFTPEEMTTRTQAELCFNFDEPFSHGHKCKHLIDKTTVNNYDTGDTIMMMICTT